MMMMMMEKAYILKFLGLCNCQNYTEESGSQQLVCTFSVRVPIQL